MKLNWISVQEMQPPRSGIWQVTRESEIVDHGYFIHPAERPFIQKDGQWLPTGWYFTDHQHMSDVLAWMPSVRPYGGPGSWAYPPAKRRPARVGDRVTAARVVDGKRTLLLTLEVEGSQFLQDDLQLVNTQSAIDHLFEMLSPNDIPDNIRIILQTDI